MSLLSSIPGLSRHRTEVPTPPAESYDGARAMRLVRDAHSLLESYYPAGALEWLREMRPDVAEYLRECGRELDAAAEAEDLPRLRKGLDLWITAHRRAFTVYQSRPPVIEMDKQGGLF